MLLAPTPVNVKKVLKRRDRSVQTLMNVALDHITALTLQLVTTPTVHIPAPVTLGILVMALNAALSAVLLDHTVLYRRLDYITVSPALLDIPRKIHQATLYHNVNVSFSY